MLLASIIAISVSIPPAAKVVAIAVIVYPLVQGLKKVSFLAPYLTGWKSMVLNFILGAIGVIVTVAPDQLYTLATLYQILDATGIAAGIHGTVKSLTPPTVLAETPPDGKVKEVPATLVPNDPAAIPVDPK